MSAERASSPCNKFQPNVFHKSKCQNCFKSRELHLLSDQDQEQAKPVFGGWLCLAPEGTDFDNPMQRSRKWQRRFFILYEDGRLSFALDDLPSTLPQGTVNISLCADIMDAEPRTGQKNALCITAAEQEIFIRADSREILNGWNDHLSVYLRTNRQNQNKKRKVDPVATQEPSPAKVAATDSNFLPPEISAESGCPPWQSEQRDQDLSRTPTWTITEAPGLDQDQNQDQVQDHAARPSCLSSVSRDPLGGRLDVATTGNGKMPTDRTNRDRRRSSSAEMILGLEAGGGAAVSRKSRSETRSSRQQDLKSDAGRLSAPMLTRRARSLDRRTSDTAITPDLLNFKKGWLVKLDGTQQWRKYWFVLSADSLRFYKDSVAEEASDLEGEIDLTKCFKVCEYQVQRNYGFQIHTPNATDTLSAMTAGIRKNWIQALMKNVHPGHAPNGTSPPTLLPRPDVMQDSVTFDCSDFRLPSDLWTRPSGPVETGDQERRKRREERRRRYESVLGAAQTAAGALSPKSLQRVEADVEECWRWVEKTLFRGDRSVQLLRDDSEMKKLLEGCRKEVEDLKAQLEESEHSRQELEARLNPAGCSLQQHELPPASETREEVLRCNLQEPPSSSPHTSIVRPDTEETRQEVRGLLPETESLEVPSPECDHPGCRQEVSSETPPGSPEGEVNQRSQDVELLTRQNEALNQLNQEMLNQLTEADREIERLKSELSSRFMETQLFHDSGRMVEDLETELRSRTQELLDAQALITSMEKRLEEPEAIGGASGLKETDANRSEMERRLKQTGETCEEVQKENAEMKAAEEHHQRNIASEEKLKQMIEGTVLRLNVFDKLLEVMAKSDTGSWTECEEQTVESQLSWEEEFWRTLHNKLSSHCHQEKWEEILHQAMEQMLLLPGLRLLPGPDGTNMLDRGGIKQLRVLTQSKISSLTCLATAMEGSAHDRLFPEHHLSSSIQAAATEAFYCCWLIWVQSRHRRELEELERRLQSEEASPLRGRVRELEEQLVVRGAELREAFESVQMEKQQLKVMCEHALVSMEESHSKTVEELQCRHQQEVERLLLESDQLLQEESAATVTAIQAIREAHRLELEREEQKRREAGSTHLEELYQRHSEEVRSYQRELQVLSQQFSLRCLENAHLAQALDAERKALSQCQQENQDLRTRNQELSSDLGSEVTRLCSLVNQDVLPLSQDLDLFQLEITLRVKESEVQCLKQEITTLKDKLQTAGQDKVNAMKKHSEVLSELNFLRVKTEQEMDELRENLRLARVALQEMSS